MIRKSRKGLNSCINIKHVKFAMKSLTLFSPLPKIEWSQLIELVRSPSSWHSFLIKTMLHCRRRDWFGCVSKLFFADRRDTELYIVNGFDGITKKQRECKLLKAAILFGPFHPFYVFIFLYGLFLFRLALILPNELTWHVFTFIKLVTLIEFFREVFIF